MGLIYVNLSQCFNLAALVAAPAGVAGAFLPAANHLPAAHGLYVVVNMATSNSYVGVANNLQTRFASRHEAAVVFGLDPATMGNVFLWFADMGAGDIAVFNTAAAPPGAPGVPAAPAAPAHHLPLWAGNVAVGPYAGPAALQNPMAVPPAIIGPPGVLGGVVNGINAIIDGANIDIEAVIIRQYLTTAALQFNTNTQKRLPFPNLTGHGMFVFLNYCVALGGAVPGGFSQRYVAPMTNF